MKVIIVGCGRVGSSLANALWAEGHDVSVIDKNPQAFEGYLSRAFGGKKLKGSGFSREVLEKAGIQEADALLAVSNGDNSNIVAARVASEYFKVPKVIARIYDPRRADIYRRLGIQTVATVSWSVGKIRDLLEHPRFEEELSFGSGEVVLTRADVPFHLAGRKVADVAVRGDIEVAVLIRKGRAFIPGPDTVLTEGDELRLLVTRDAIGQTEKFFGQA